MDLLSSVTGMSARWWAREVRGIDRPIYIEMLNNVGAKTRTIGNRPSAKR